MVIGNDYICVSYATDASYNEDDEIDFNDIPLNKIGRLSPFLCRIAPFCPKDFKKSREWYEPLGEIQYDLYEDISTPVFK
jgi:hypothetical protein